MTAEHPNVTGIRRVFDAFLGGETRALFEVIAEDAVWRVAGSVPVAVPREFAGRDAIFQLFRLTRKLTGGTYRSELRWSLADDEHGIAVYRATGERLGRRLDIDQALLIELRGGRWTDVLAVPSDPQAFDTFWT